MSPASGLSDRELIVRRLAAGRAPSWFLRGTAIVLATLAVYAWSTGRFSLDDFVSETRRSNVRRFVGELRPHPLQARSWDWEIAAGWTADLMRTKGLEAAITTLAISVAAIVFAGILASLLALPATRTFASPEAYGPHARAPSTARRIAWSALVWLTRAFLIFLRAVPEYVWAFMLVVVMGPSPWSAALALALHNAGVLGKLNAEIVENLPPATLSALRALGAGRRQIAIAGILPAVASRFLLFFFYRWETCVREATVLGMLGIISIGFFVQDARARQHYDVMFALIVIGGVIVLIGDLVSAAARTLVRKSS